MYAPLMELSRFIPLIISFAGMTIASFYILYNDFKHLKVRMWMILLLEIFSILGVTIGRVASGDFQIYWVLLLPVYAVLDFLNTKFNHNRLIGQADIDIFLGSITILVPTIMLVCSQNYDNYTQSVVLIQLSGIFSDMLIWLLIGFVASLIVAFIKWIVFRVKNRDAKATVNEIGSKIVVGTYMVMNDPKTVVEGMKKDFIKKCNKEGDGVEVAEVEEIPETKPYTGEKLRGTKIPVCLSFIPLLYAMTYIGIYITF